MKFKFASWNVNYRNLTKKHINFIRLINCDMIALQECKQSFYDELVANELFEEFAFSLMLRPPKKDEGRARQFGCAICTKFAFPIRNQFLLGGAPLPERTLITPSNYSGV